MPHIEVEDIFNPGRNHTVQVTEGMGKQIVDTLHPLVKEAADSFINIEVSSRTCVLTTFLIFFLGFCRGGRSR